MCFHSHGSHFRLVPRNGKLKNNISHSSDLDSSSWLSHLPGLLHGSDFICSFCILFHFKKFCFIVFCDQPQNPVGFIWIFLLRVNSGYLINKNLWVRYCPPVKRVWIFSSRPIISLLSMYPGEMKTHVHKNTWTEKFITALCS